MCVCARAVRDRAPFYVSPIHFCLPTRFESALFVDIAWVRVNPAPARAVYIFGSIGGTFRQFANCRHFVRLAYHATAKNESFISQLAAARSLSFSGRRQPISHDTYICHNSFLARYQGILSEFRAECFTIPIYVVFIGAAARR